MSDLDDDLEACMEHHHANGGAANSPGQHASGTSLHHLHGAGSGGAGGGGAGGGRGGGEGGGERGPPNDAPTYWT